jgi:REP element-mobilizing transposase RayT
VRGRGCGASRRPVTVVPGSFEAPLCGVFLLRCIERARNGSDGPGVPASVVIITHMSSPLAYFLTWTTYGTWLHGDERGSVDDEHNRVRTPFLVPDAALRERRAGALKHAPFVMSETERDVVDAAIREHSLEVGWVISALNVRSNHVHVVVRADDAAPERVVAAFKAKATRRLRDRGFVTPDRRVWTTHGSTRWINDERSFGAAVDYVLNGQ